MRAAALPRIAGLVLVFAFTLAGCADDPVDPSAADVGTLAPTDDAVLSTIRAAQGSDRVRVMLTLGSRARARSMAATLRRAGGGASVIHEYDHFPFVNAWLPSAALQGLRRAPGVVLVREDVLEEPLLDVSVPLIGGDVVQGHGLNGAGSAIVILDTGIDQDHPFVDARITLQACVSSTAVDGFWSSESLCQGGVSGTLVEGSDAADIAVPACGTNGGRCEHGTHVAGIAAGEGDASNLAAPVAGVAPGADLIPVQIFSYFPNYGGVLTWNGDQVKALDWVYDLVVDRGMKIAAVNMSIGGGGYAGYCDAQEPERATIINALRDEGVAVVIASGNNGYRNGVSAPACIEAAITVGATDDHDAIAGFSNRGPQLDLFAPGVQTLSAVPGGGYESWNGTSMATPHVAGAVAVLRQADPDATVDDIEAALEATGVPLSFYGGLTRSRIQLDAAVTYLLRGHEGQIRTQGFWQTEVRGVKSYFEDGDLVGFLRLVDLESDVFSEVRALGTLADAEAVLVVRGRRSISEQLDVQLLAAWLNHASGAIDVDQLVDTDGDLVPDTEFGSVIDAAESVRLDPAATDAALQAQHEILAQVNGMDAG